VLRDLKDVQDHLAYRQPEAPKVLLGQGLGALYALAHACEQGEGLAGLILIAPLTAPNFALPEKPSGLMKLFKKQGADAAGSIGFQAEHLTALPAEREARAGDELVHNVITVRAAQEAMRAAAEYLPKLGQLGVPVLVIIGDRDPHCDAAGLRAAVRSGGVELDCIAGGRHDLLHDSAAAELRVRIVRWLEQRFPR
jgi:alpha-beta hydrolase superfamily lysophospholipase